MQGTTVARHSLHFFAVPTHAISGVYFSNQGDARPFLQQSPCQFGSYELEIVMKLFMPLIVWIIKKIFYCLSKTVKIASISTYRTTLHTIAGTAIVIEATMNY